MIIPPPSAALKKVPIPSADMERVAAYVQAMTKPVISGVGAGETRPSPGPQADRPHAAVPPADLFIMAAFLQPEVFADARCRAVRADGEDDDGEVRRLAAREDTVRGCPGVFSHLHPRADQRPVSVISVRLLRRAGSRTRQGTTPPRAASSCKGCSGHPDRWMVRTTQPSAARRVVKAMRDASELRRGRMGWNTGRWNTRMSRSMNCCL